LKRFRYRVTESNVLRDVKKHRFYTPKSELRQMARRRAARRARRHQRRHARLTRTVYRFVRSDTSNHSS
jgi:ribosomal protein S21